MNWLDLTHARDLCIGAVAIAVTISACSVHYHDEKAAAASASSFARFAFVDRNIADAYRMMAAETRAGVSVEQFAETIAKMHPKASPSSLVAREFEPIPGQNGMYIYLEGSAPDERFYYIFQMIGDGIDGYQVAGFRRGDGPYPPSQRRPL